MKKLLLGAAMVAFGLSSVNAQEGNSGGQTAKGKWLIEANTGFSAGGGEFSFLQHTANTGFGLVSIE